MWVCEWVGGRVWVWVSGYVGVHVKRVCGAMFGVNKENTNMRRRE